MWKRIDRWKSAWYTDQQIQNALKYEKEQRDFWKKLREEENFEIIEQVKEVLKNYDWKLRNLAFNWFWIHRKIPHLPKKKESRFIYYNDWKSEIEFYINQK